MRTLLEKITNYISEQEPDIKVKIERVAKNNDVMLTGIAIFDNQRISPVFYIDSFIEMGWSAEDIGDYVLKEYRNATYPDNDIIDRIMDYESVKHLLTPKLINKKYNKKNLQKLPHKDFLDLAVIILIMFNPTKDGYMSVKVTNELIKKWNVTFDDVYEQAIQNLDNERTVLTNMNDLLSNYVDDLPKDNPLYVLSSRRGVNGASHILKNDIKDFADSIERDVIILPSSIHEVLLLPLCEGVSDDVDYISNMIQDINNTQVIPDERLSDHAYVYRRSTRTIENLI